MSEERPQEEQPEQQPVQEPGQQPEPIQQPEPLPEAAERVDWRDRRIGEQQQRLRERNARIQELEAQLTALAGQQPPGGQPQGQQPTYPTAGVGDIQRQINEAAAQMAATQEFTRRCNEVAESGRKVYGNFDQRVGRLTGLVDANDPQQVQQYNSFLQAVMETGQAPKLIYELGGDLNEASRVMAMTPVRMAVELTKMSIRPGTDASGAPRPLNPLASASQQVRTVIAPDDPEGSDTLTMEEWMRRREEQVNSRRQRTLG